MSRLLKLLSFLLVLALAQNAAIRWGEMRAAVRTAPGVAQTSGCEEESLFALWRTVHQGTPYLDSLRVPYASAYFNWLFYHGYALALAPVVSTRGDAALPWASRAVTFAGALAGATMVGFLFRRILACSQLGLESLGWAAGALLFLGPLAGWWSLTARPDIWALTCEVLAVALCLLTFHQRSLVTLLSCSLALYAAWAFKQNYVTGLGAILVLFTLHGRWRDAAVVAALSASLWLGTALLLGSEYRTCLTNATSSPSVYAALGVSNLTTALIKAAPFFLFVPWVGAEFIRVRKAGRSTDLPALAVELGILGTLFGLLLAIPSSCVLGATQNYYFSAALFAALGVCGALARWHRAWPAVILLSTGLVLALAPTLGFAPRISLAKNVADLAARWAVWSREPEPRFSADLRLNLPWLAPASPPLVLAYKYPEDRAKGLRFEQDGVGGLIARGHFRSLLLPASTGTHHDGGDLGRYERVQQLGSASLYQLRAARPPAP